MGKRVIFKILEQEAKKKESVLITIDKEESPFILGEVVAVGTECGFNVGTKILANKFDAGVVIWEGETLQMIEPNLIIAIDGNS